MPTVRRLRSLRAASSSSSSSSSARRARGRRGAARAAAVAGGVALGGGGEAFDGRRAGARAGQEGDGAAAHGRAQKKRPSGDASRTSSLADRRRPMTLSLEQRFGEDGYVELGTETATLVAVLNDLGGSENPAGGRGVQDALVALNFNGQIDNSDTTTNTSSFSFNPDAGLR